MEADGRPARGRHFATVPLQANRAGLLEVAAEVEGRSVRLIVDTGANATVLDRERAKRLGIEMEGDRGEALGCVTGEATMAAVESLQIGPVGLKGHAVAILDLGAVLRHLSAGEAETADGILGADVLRSARAVIDYGTQELRLSSQLA